MGRLSKQKRFDLLIKAFALIASKYPDWSLHIYGEGKERNYLTQLIQDCALSNRITLPGSTNEPYSVLKSCDIFVLCSDYEGFPNVLLQAMATGAACIATNCPTGPSEIVQPGLNGLLTPVGDIHSLSKCIEQLINNSNERSAIGSAASNIVGKFDPEEIWQLWDGVLANTAAK